ncbi:hypothetical protein EK21DRAFT_61594 [Setomelanomma holmii]|uniref:Uncharacterized protein n=1 Tax=Setomelanomma holmii TaxID=210430 RepID=A0A9P4HCR2_9PLEO|nr:hypothetical protein EK21DRAFT_61594 [Setomelanomma holmii]
MSIELNYRNTLVGPRFIYNRTPIKIRALLIPDLRGQAPPIGWAIWIDEEFAYMSLIFMAMSVGILVFAAWYTAEETPKANGWAVGSYLLCALTFILGGWIAWAKDSKHA